MEKLKEETGELNTESLCEILKRQEGCGGRDDIIDADRVFYEKIFYKAFKSGSLYRYVYYKDKECTEKIGNDWNLYLYFLE